MVEIFLLLILYLYVYRSKLIFRSDEIKTKTMKLLVLYEKVILAIEQAEKQIVIAKGDKNKVLVFFNSLKLYVLEGIRIFIRFLCLLFGDSAENFLIFSKLGKDAVVVCNNSYCGYRKMERKVRFLSKTAFILVLISTILTSSILYFFMPGKPSSKAATFYWNQTDWSGGPDDGTYPTHNSNQSGWAKYSAKDDNIAATVDGLDKVLKLTMTDVPTTDTSDADYLGSGYNIALSNEGSAPHWPYRRPVTITGGSSDQTNYPIKITLNTTITGGSPYPNIKSDGSDIRFTNSSGTELTYWIQSWDNAGTSIIWVKVDSIPASGATIYMYYGNSQAVFASDCATNVSATDNCALNAFTFFDDFSGSAKWTGSGGTTGTNNVGSAFISQTGTGTSTSTLTSNTGLIGNGTFSATLNVKNVVTSDGAGGTSSYKLQFPNTATADDATSYGSYTPKTYTLSGNDVQIKLYASATTSGTKGSYDCGYCDDGSCGDAVSCDYDCDSYWNDQTCYTYFTATSAVYIDDVFVRKLVSSGTDPADTPVVGNPETAAGQAAPSSFSDVSISGVGTSASIMLSRVFTGSGADGAITISANKNLNTNAIATGRTKPDAVNYSVTALSANTATLSVAPVAGELAVGDEVLLINLKGISTAYDNVGNYESFLIQSVSDNVVTFSTNKTKFYGNGVSDDTNIGTGSTNQKVMLQRVPNYTNVTVSDGYTLTVSDWDGNKGGVIFFRASGTVSVKGMILAGRGYTGGVMIGDVSGYGDGGETYNGKAGAGASWVPLDVAATSGQGGGGGCSGYGGHSGAAGAAGAGGGGGGRAYGGGGGGGYRTVGSGGSNGFPGSGAIGGDGSSTPSGPSSGSGCSGGGGGTYGSDQLTKLYLGSGGGASSGLGNGISGGGIILIKANQIDADLNGSINDSGNASGGMPGGGSGGSLYLVNNTISAGFNLVSAVGGAGGIWGVGRFGGTGGNGGIRVDFVDGYSGTTTPSSYSGTATGDYYSSSGTYISQIKDMGMAVYLWSNISWHTAEPSSATRIVLKARTSNSSAMTGATDFGICNVLATVTSANASGSATMVGNNCIHAGDRYIQYQAVLSTTDITVSPSIDDISTNYSGYPASQSLTSSAFNAQDSGNIVAQISWTQIDPLPDNTAIRFQVRSAPNNNNGTPGNILDDIPGTWSGWMGPDGAPDSLSSFFYYTSGSDRDSNCNASGGAITCTIPTDHPLKVGNDDQWIQYKVSLESNGANTPTIYDTVLSYVINASPVVSNVSASQDSSGIINLSYSVSDADSTSITGYILADIGLTLNEDLAVDDATQITLSGDVSVLPVSGTNTIQIDNEQITYTSRSGNNLEGAITRGVNGTTASVHNGISSGPITVWIKGTTIASTGDTVTDGAMPITGFSSDINNPTDKTATWNIKNDYNGIYASGDVGRIRVSMNDANLANQVGNGDSAAFVIDTKDPAPQTNPIVIDASTGLALANITITAQEDTTLYVKISNNSNLSADGLNTVLSAGDWVDLTSYATANPNEYSLTGWQFVTDPDTVYMQFMDSKGNTSSIISKDTVPSPSNFMIQDTSNKGASEFRNFIAWTVSALSDPDFKDYVLESSSDNSTFTELKTETDKATNYYADQNLAENQDVYYRVYQEDQTGNKSSKTDVKHGIANGTQDADEGGGGTAVLDYPIVTYDYVKRITSAGETIMGISWNSIDPLSLADTFNHYEIWYGDNKADVESKSGTAAMWSQAQDPDLNAIDTINTKITGLTASTAYYFKVWAVDNSSNYVLPSAIAAVTDSTATVSFITDKISDSSIEYSKTSYSNFDSEQGVPSMVAAGEDHSVTLTGLDSNQSYYYRIKTTSSAGAAKYLPASDDSNYYFKTTTDTDAPTITIGPSADPTYNTAAITWTSSEAATYELSYGTDSNYSSGVVTNGSYNFSHSAEITSGLLESTPYLYKIKLTDSSGNFAEYTNDGSNDYSFTTKNSTDTTPPVISNYDTPTVLNGDVTANSAVITWDTNEGANSRVEYGKSLNSDSIPLYTNIQGSDTTYTTTAGHSVTLSGLDPGTTYYYQIRSSDAYGNIGVKNNDGAVPVVYFSFTTDGIPPSSDTTLPTIAYINKSFNSDSVDITFTASDDSGVARVLIGYNAFNQGANDFKYEAGSTLDMDDGSPHTLTIGGLTSSTEYIFRLRAQDDSGNKSDWLTDESDGSNFRFTTSAGNSNPSAEITYDQSSLVTHITSTTAKITWSTNIPANSLVDYSTTDSVFTSTSGNYTSYPVGARSVTLANLVPGSTYYFRLRSVTDKDVPSTLPRSVDDNGNPLGFTFVTPTGIDEIPPAISNVSASSSTNYATIIWDTDENSSSIVEYGITSSSYNTLLGNKSESVISHSVILSGLIPGVKYYYRVKSADSSGNVSTNALDSNGDPYSFTTTSVDNPMSDTTGPTINFNESTGVADITANSAVIKWTTNEDSDSTVGYSISPSIIFNLQKRVLRYLPRITA